MILTQNIKCEKSIVKAAAIEFFLPIIKIIEFIKNLNSVKKNTNEIIKKINKIEENMEYISYFELKEMCKRMESVILKQESLLTNINRELAGQKNIHSIVQENSYDSIASHISRLVNKTFELKTQELMHGNELSNAAAEIGLANIEFILKKIKKDEGGATPYLFGVNKGGSFLATYLAHRMDLHQKYLVKCDYIVEYNKILCEDRNITGPVVVIDDVVRTGNTMRIIKAYLQDKYPQSKVFSIVLVASLDSDFEDVVDYSPWVTKYSSVALPWSKKLGEVIELNEYFDDMEMDQIVSRLE